MKKTAVRTTEVEHDLSCTTYYVVIGELKSVYIKISKEDYDILNDNLSEELAKEVAALTR